MPKELGVAEPRHVGERDLKDAGALRDHLEREERESRESRESRERAERAEREQREQREWV